MVWRPLGNVRPGLSWRQFGDAGVGAETIRITHTYNRFPSAYALLRFDVLDDYFGITRLYPIAQNRIITVNIPQALFDSGLIVWYPSIKIGRFRQASDLENWTVNLEYWSGPAVGSRNLSSKLDELLTDVERIEAKLGQQANQNPPFTDQLPNDLDDTL